MVALTRSTVVDYLLSRGVLDASVVTGGSVRVVEASRRNRNFKIETENGGVFVKQAGAALPEFQDALRREARCCRLAESDPAAAALKSCLPRLLHEEPHQGTVVTELIAGAESLAQVQARNGAIPPEVAARIGRLLSHLHHELIAFARSGAREAGLDAPVPWIFRFHRMPAGQSTTLAPANRQMLAILQRDPWLPGLIAQVESQWRPEDTVIHGDFRWDNYLTPRNGASSTAPGPASMYLVDWELASVGDRAWDVGGILHAFLVDWVLALTIPPGLPAERIPDLGEEPMARAQAAARSFWQTYIDGIRLSDAESAELLDRSIRFAAVRALQTVFEYSNRLPQLSPNSICLLQLSLNVMKDPKGAGSALLGLEVRT